MVAVSMCRHRQVEASVEGENKTDDVLEKYYKNINIINYEYHNFLSIDFSLNNILEVSRR